MHEIPDLGNVNEIRVPAEYRDDPSKIKAYLTGFMNAWLLALRYQQNGQDQQTVTLDDF